MARSRKKNPWVKYGGFPEGKKFANRRVRYYKDVLPNGKWYRKLFCSWDIYDQRFFDGERKYHRK